MVDFNKLLNAIDKTQSKASSQSYDNDRSDEWVPAVDKAGNGTAIIRFLPDANADEIPFVRVYSYGFQVPETGKWYIENSLQTLGQEDPCNSLSFKYKKSNDPDEQALSKIMARRTYYYSNILVIKDEANPDNEGKVFKFRYGQKIFDKIVAAAKPEFEDDAPINAFATDGTGADFLMKIKQVSGYRNYDDSKFSKAKPLKGDVDEITSKCYDLQKIVAPENFKSYADLEKRLNLVLGLSAPTASQTPRTTREAEDDVDTFVEQVAEVKTPKAAAKPAPKVESSDDDDLAFFQNLLED